MLDGNLSALNGHENAADALQRRAEARDVWRQVRRGELEAGLDLEALAVTLDEYDPAEWHAKIVAAMCAPGALESIIMLAGIKRLLIERTLEREEAHL